MDGIGVHLIGSAKAWYDHMACDVCRERFSGDIQDAVTAVLLECLERATHYPHSFLREAHRVGLLGRKKVLSLPIADFSLGVLPAQVSALCVVGIVTYPDCACTIIH